MIEIPKIKSNWILMTSRFRFRSLIRRAPKKLEDLNQKWRQAPPPTSNVPTPPSPLKKKSVVISGLQKKIRTIRTFWPPCIYILYISMDQKTIKALPCFVVPKVTQKVNPPNKHYHWSKKYRWQFLVLYSSFNNLNLLINIFYFS